MYGKRINKTELQDLVEERLDEAKVLLSNKKYNGALYLAGYCIELALKVRICTLLDKDDYPEHLNGYKIHDFKILLELAGLKNKFDLKLNEDENFNKQWVRLKNWNQSYRYNSLELTDEELAKITIQDMEDENGILNWVRRQW